MFQDFLINLVASAVFDFTKQQASNISKTEFAQSILRDLRLTKTHNDFEHRYVEALVEMRFQGKSKVVLNFFRAEGIAQTFFNFYYDEQKGNQAAFDTALAAQIEALRVGDEVKEAGVDVGSEVNQFWMIFGQKVAETRSVKEVELFQEVQALPQKIQALAKNHYQPSGQIFTLQQFAASSKRNIYAFPITLENTFFRRENELTTLLERLKNTPITIVSGKAGIGKTKLCLEAMHQFLERCPAFQACCICPNEAGDSIYHDLQALLQPGKKYLLFFDDANRQLPNLRSALTAMESPPDCEIHLLATVRDYAEQEVKTALGKFKVETIPVKPLDEKAILEILKSEDFDIQHSDYQSRILSIAKGNLRIAIMLADRAIDAKRLEVLNNVLDVYEFYFKQIQHDNVDLAHPEVLQTFGLIALLQNIDTAQTEYFQQLLSHFGLTATTFRTAAELLDRIELVAMSADKRYIRIDEQTMGGYIFYKVFIGEKLLPFATVLEHYFDDHWRRIQEGVFTAANDFDFAAVEKSIGPDLKNVWENLRCGETARAVKFLKTFWLFLREETLAFIAEKVEELPMLDAPKFKTEHPREVTYFDNDWVIGLLEKFFWEDENDFKTALSAGFHYVARAPHAMPDWVKVLREKLAPNRRDKPGGFLRQKIFLDWMLLNADARKPEYLAAFFALIPDLLQTSRNVFESGVTRDIINSYEFLLPDTAEVRDFRQAIWQFLERSFPDLPNECFLVLKKHTAIGYRSVRSLLEFDLPQVLRIWEKFCSPGDFLACFYLHSLENTFKNAGLASSELSGLAERYSCRAFRVFRVLDQNQLRYRKNRDEKPLPHEEFMERKKQELAEAFGFETLSDFAAFSSDFILISSFNEELHWNLHGSFDWVLHNNFQKNPDRGFSFIQHILEKGNPTGYVPYSLSNAVIQSGAGNTRQFWEMLTSHEFEKKQHWLEIFYRLLPPERIDENYFRAMLAFYKTAEQPMIWHTEHLENYRRFCPKIFRDVLVLTVKKNEAGCRAVLWFDFFADNIHQFSADDSPLLQKAYFQQAELDQHSFDHSFRNWLAILELDSDFLFEYIRWKNWDDPYKSQHDHTNLGIVWTLPNAEEVVEKALLAVDWVGSPSISPHSYVANELFQAVPTEQHERAKAFLENFLETNAIDIARVQLVFNLVRNNFGEDFYEKCFLLFLDKNKDLLTFEGIRWGYAAKMRAIFGNDVNHAEMEASRWEKVLSMLSKVSDQFLVAKHRAFVKGQIDAALAAAEHERNWRHPFGY